MLWSILFGKSKSNEFSLIFFFIIHYGFFVAIQSIFGFSLFSINGNNFIKQPFNLIENYFHILNLEDIQFALPAILITHFGKFITVYIHLKKYQKFTAKELMFKPYVRIFIQQFVVILSFFFIVFNKEAGIIAAVLLICFRLVIDLIFESIKENSEITHILSEKLAYKNISKEEVEKQLTTFTE